LLVLLVLLFLMIEIVFIGLRSTSDNSINVVQLIYEINNTVVKLVANCRDFLTVAPTVAVAI
jgi:hypothetical protein